MKMRTLRAQVTAWAIAVSRWLATDTCFYVILGLLAFQAAWLALSARYPMAFDEDFHFGLIQLHASQWLPFFTTQSPHTAQFGAIVSDPSYLYHYLFSFPYRLLTLITHNQVAQIIVLRFLNISLAIWGFILARRLMLRLGGSKALTHAALLLICLVPIVPFLAAQINYDNLFIPLTLLTLLLTFQLFDDIQSVTVQPLLVVLLGTLLMLGSLVKYAFLPIMVAIIGLVLWRLIRARVSWPTLLASARSGVRQTNKWLLVLTIAIFMLSGGLFVERYAGNIIRYHSPDPDCAQVLTVQQCLSYSPWARNYNYEHSGQPINPNTLFYLGAWPAGLWFRSFFAVSDTYDTAWPLPLSGGASIALATLGILVFIYFSRRLLSGNVYRQTVLITMALYLLALFADNYQDYLKTGVPVAVNGRYLLPFLPAIFLLVGLAYRRLWQREAYIKGLAVTLSVIAFVEGGGMLAFIVRSQDSWYWPNPVVVQVNRTVRTVLKTTIIGG